MRWLSIILILPLAFLVHLAPVPAQDKTPLELELEVRQTRLEAHFEAYAAWVDRQCDLSDEQRSQLNAAIKQGIEKSQELYAKPQPANNNQSHLYDYSPVRFVAIRGAAWGVSQAGLQEYLAKILNDKQREKLQAAKTKRRQELHNLFVEYVLHNAGEVLYLTSKQKGQIKPQFPFQHAFLDTGAYSFSPQTHLLQEKSMDSLFDRIKIELDPVQENLLNPSRKQVIRFMRDDGLDGWKKKLQAGVEDQQKKLYQILNSRIDYLKSEYQVDSTGIRYLEVAGKGVIVREISKWEDKISYNFDFWAENRNKLIIPGQFLGVARGIKNDILDQHPLWNHAVEKVISQSIVEQRRMESQAIIAGYATAMLDQELWLSSGQRDDIAALLLAFPHVEDEHHHGHAFELCLVGIAVLGDQQKELRLILNENQLAAFNALQGPFQNQDDYLMIQSKGDALPLQQFVE